MVLARARLLLCARRGATAGHRAHRHIPRRCPKTPFHYQLRGRRCILHTALARPRHVLFFVLSSALLVFYLWQIVAVLLSSCETRSCDEKLSACFSLCPAAFFHQSPPMWGLPIGESGTPRLMWRICRAVTKCLDESIRTLDLAFPDGLRRLDLSTTLPPPVCYL